MLKTKSIYAPPEPGDGVRVLVSRFWPRGVRRDLVQEWCRELSPSPYLLKQYKREDMPWDTFIILYKKEIDTDTGRQAIKDLKIRAELSDVTLLCYEPTGTHCHRHLLYDIILDPQKLHVAFEPKYTDDHECIPVRSHIAN